MAYIPLTHQTFGLLSDIKQQAGTAGAIVYLSGMTSTADGNGGNYLWDATSVLTPDDFKVIQVTGLSTGRWIRLYNTNYTSGSQNLSGAALQNSYVVNHNMGVTPSKVFIQPTNAAASILNYVSARNSTSFTVTFLTVPVVGTNNLSIDWLAIK